MASKRAIPVRVPVAHTKCNNENINKQSHKPALSSLKSSAESTTGDRVKQGVLRTRNPSANNGKVTDKTKALTSSKVSVKSFSEQRKEKQHLEEQLIKLKNEVELLHEEKKQLSETNNCQQTELDTLVEKNKDLEERIAKVCHKLDTCEHHLETLGYDPVTREKLETVELEEQTEIENTVISVAKFNDELTAFKDRNTQIISSIEEILKTV